MPTGLSLPLIMASVFTLGCILIQKAGKRAEAITEGLGFLFLLCVLLNAIALLAFFVSTKPTGVVLIRSMSAG
ncbi:hypothetical protein [Methylobacterium sp. CM6257]|jgi:hypothetical protein